MATIVDELVVKLGLDGSGFLSGAKTASASTDKLKKDIQNKAKDMSEAGKTASEFFKQLSTAATQFFAVIGSAVAIKNMIEDTVAASTAIQRLSQNLNQSAEDINAWGNAAQMGGGTAEDAQRTFEMLTRSLEQFSLTGESQLLPYLRSIGAEMVGVDGHAKATGDFLLELAGKVEGLSRPTGFNLLKNLGIDGGTINILLKGKAATEELIAKQKEQWLVTQKSGEAALKLTESWIRLKTSLGTVARYLTDAVTPAIDAVLGAINTMGDWIASHGDLVKGFFTALAGVLLLALAPSLWGVATAVFAVLGPFALMTAAILAASAAVALLYEDWVVWTHGGKAALGDLFQFFADGWKKVVQVFDSSLARLKQGWKDVKAFVGMEDTEPTHPVAKAVVAAAKVNRGARVTQELGDLIGSGEGTYTSINRGTSHGKILGSGKQANLTDMTIGGVMAQQRIHSEAMKRGVPGQGLFAVGKYQFTPDTLASAVKKLGLKEGAKFSPQTQDELFAASLPPEVFQYSQGKASKDAATEALSHMWASVGAPSRNGGSYYGSGNKASISTQQVGSVLDNMKLAYRNQVGKMSAEHPVGGDNSTSVQIDSINIHTQATDAPGLARTISDAIRSQTTVSQSDAGMS